MLCNLTRFREAYTIPWYECRCVKLAGTMQLTRRTLLLKLLLLHRPCDLNLASVINNACIIVSMLHLDKLLYLEIL